MKHDKLRNLNQGMPSEDEERLADNLRALAFQLVFEHPVAAAHLTVAAGSIAPTSRTDLNIAKHLWGGVADFSNELSLLHAEARRAERSDGRLTTDRINIRGLDPSWAYLFEDRIPK